MKKSVFMLLCLMAFLSVFTEIAGAFAVTNDWEYEINDIWFSEDTVKITKYIGNQTKVIMPDKISGYKVASIGTDTFSGNSGDNITSIQLPSNLESIDGNPFIYCPLLKEISISPLNSTFTVIDNVLFDRSMKMLMVYPQAKTGKM